MSTELLKKCYLFEVLNQSQMDELISKSRRIQLGREQVLFRMGDEARYFYLLEQGQVKLSLNSARGIEKVLAVIRPGEMFAEAVMFLEQRRYPANCSALQESVVLGIDMQQFRAYLDQSNELCMALLHDLSARLHRKIREIESLALQNATIRTIGYLCSQINDHHQGEVLIKLDTPKQTIASVLSITPETFSRVLNQLNREGLVELLEKEVLITDAFALKERLFV